MQRLEVSGAVRPIYGSLGVKRLMALTRTHLTVQRQGDKHIIPQMCTTYTELFTSFNNRSYL